MLAGCSALYQPSPELNGFYYEQIKDWQKRVKKEGWSETLIDEVTIQIVELAKFRTESRDHWDTPKEFMQRGFQGDCEDIAVFMMATLKRLEYPFGVRVMLVETSMQDHSVLKVKMPNGKWKIYDTVPMPSGNAGRLIFKPIVEFDENNIIYHKS